MIKIFIDSDIIIDVLAKRKEYQPASELLKLLDGIKLSGYTSPIVIANVHYILTKHTDKNKSIHAIKVLRKKINILPIDEEIIDTALDGNFKDFEDGIQYLMAKKKQMDFIITRNKKDYKHFDIKIFDAREFVDFYSRSDQIINI